MRRRTAEPGSRCPNRASVSAPAEQPHADLAAIPPGPRQVHDHSEATADAMKPSIAGVTRSSEPCDMGVSPPAPHRREWTHLGQASQRPEGPATGTALPQPDRGLVVREAGESSGVQRLQPHGQWLPTCRWSTPAWCSSRTTRRSRPGSSIGRVFPVPASPRTRTTRRRPEPRGARPHRSPAVPPPCPRTYGLPGPPTTTEGQAGRGRAGDRTPSSTTFLPGACGQGLDSYS